MFSGVLRVVGNWQFVNLELDGVVINGFAVTSRVSMSRSNLFDFLCLADSLSMSFLMSSPERMPARMSLRIRSGSRASQCDL